MPRYGSAQGSLPDVLPAPQTTIVVLSPVQGPDSDALPAVLDSGAYKTCLPKSSILKLGAGIDWTVSKPCRGFSGPAQPMPCCRVSLRFPSCGRVFKDIEVIARDSDRAYALIGRDILNQYRVVLDGPAEEWSHDQSPGPNSPSGTA